MTDSTDTLSQDPLTMYIILRKDLTKTLGWNAGSVIAQACHATSAALWLNQTDVGVQEYMKGAESGHMHKVVLEVKGDPQLQNLCTKLDGLNVRYQKFVEQPENFLTCVATLPVRKEQVGDLFRKSCQLYK